MIVWQDYNVWIALISEVIFFVILREWNENAFFASWNLILKFTKLKSYSIANASDGVWWAFKTIMIEEKRWKWEFFWRKPERRKKHFSKRKGGQGSWKDGGGLKGDLILGKFPGRRRKYCADTKKDSGSISHLEADSFRSGPACP